MSRFFKKLKQQTKWEFAVSVCSVEVRGIRLPFNVCGV
jgi:hypothetical protein